MDLRGVKILLILTKEQRQAFYDSAYYSDLMYNTALQWNIDYYNECEKFYSYYDMCYLLPGFKRENPEFKSVGYFVLVSAVSDLRTAFDRRRQGAGFPKFKKTGKKLSFGLDSNRLYVFENTVKIPSVGIVKCKNCHWLTRGKSDEELVSLKYHNPHIKFGGKYGF